MRKRQFPFLGDRGGVSSFIHLDDAAAATVLALEHDGPIYNIVDDEPASVREWLPVLANALGAEPPRHFPVWLARLFAKPVPCWGTESRGLEREGQTRAGLGPTLPELAAGRRGRYASTTPTDGRKSHPAARTRRSPT
ncbi:MAG: NAD-dependent epimerase/dehydratase family protein [Actinomycetota bacterium]